MHELKRLIKSFGHAVDGIIYTLKTQRNMQIHAGAAIAALVLGWVLHITWGHVMLVFFSIFLVFIMEVFNTAVEAAVDLVTSAYHPKAKIAKDAAAGAVLLAAVLAVIVGLYVFKGPVLALLR